MFKCSSKIVPGYLILSWCGNLSVLYNLDIYVSKKREANNSSWNTQNSILVFFSFIFLVFICTQSPFTVHQLVLGVDRIHHHRRDHDQNLHGRHLVHHCLLLLSVIHKISIIIQKPLLTSYANTKWDVFKKLCALPWGMLTTILLFGQCSFFKLQISTVIPVYEIKLYNPFWIILTVSGLFVTYYKLKLWMILDWGGLSTIFSSYYACIWRRSYLL